MEQNLQAVLDLINADASLSEDEKAIIIARLNAADKKMGVDAFRIERGEHLKKTMSVLLDETIEELEQKRKTVEEKNRDLEIEAALERVRTRTMAMQHSGELAETAYILFQQFKELGENPDQATIGIINEEEHVIEYWVTMYGSQVNKVFKFSIDEPNVTNKIYKAWKGKKKSLVIDLSGKALTDFAKYRESMGGARLNRGEKRRVINVAFFSKGLINVQSNETRSEESIGLLVRFAAVFDGTYTRFLDLQKAEAQARESQIELALERVRARTMAMQHSDELPETAAVLFQQFRDLGEEPIQATIGIVNEAEGVIEFSVTDWRGGGSQIAGSFKGGIEEPTLLNKEYTAWKAKKKSLVVDLTGQELQDWIAYRNIWSNTIARSDDTYGRRAVSFAFFSKGHISISTGEPPLDESIRLLERFAGVFDGTYTRFLDLKNAEAQARESQIELALERVRARTMAMQKSEELKEIIKVVYEQLVHLNILAEHAGFIMDYQANDDMHIWLADKHFDPSYVAIPYFDSPHWNSFIEAKKKGTDFFANLLSFEEKNKFYQDLFALIPGVTDEATEYYLNCPGLAISTVLLDNVGLYIENFSGISYTADENSTLMRFGKVFQQTYTRFLDLQKAEEQAREAQIQLALERVRAGTMAMQKSDELAETATVLFQQLHNLGISSERTFIGIPNDDTRKIELWGTQQGGNQMSTRFDYEADATYAFREIYKAWQEKRNELTVILKGKKLEEHVNYVRNVLHMPLLAGLVQKQRILYNTFFSKGLLMSVTPDAQPKETLEILERFAAVFDQTYTRFLDLQRAEAQAREAQIQLGLERVRAAAMAMHSSADVGNATALVFSELHSLGVNTIRCGVLIIEEATKFMEVWSATSAKEGKVEKGSGKLDLNSTPFWQKTYNAWKEKKSVFTYELAGQELADYYSVVAKAAGYRAPQQTIDFAASGNISEARQYCCVFMFPEGAVFTFTEEPISAEFNQVLARFTAVFALTYRRYLDLQKAEAAAREAQIEAALERVRSKTMAMHNSQDVGDTVGVMFHEFVKLGIEKMIRCGIGIMSHENRTMELWTAKWGENEKVNLLIGHLDMTIHKMLGSIYDAWKSKQSDFTYQLAGSDLVTYAKVINSYPDYPLKYDLNSLPPAQFFSDFFFNEGVIFAFTSNSLSDEIVTVLKRFAGVFGQTYRRYLDLLKAEAAAHEARIEASLERVRGKAMAMRNSNDLSITASMVFIELRNLGINPIRSGVGLITKGTRRAKIYSDTSLQTDADLSLMGEVTLSGHPVFELQYQAWLKQENCFAALEGVELAAYYKILSVGLNANLGASGKKRDKEYGHWFMFSEGFLYAWSDKSYTETEIKILERFKNVVELTFRRYIELQQSEIIARDAVKEASLDRVRAEIASMRSTSDLDRITPLIWNELTILGIPFIRCGVFIMDEEKELIHTFLSTPDGKAIGAFHIPFDTSGNFEKMVASWRNNEPYIDHWKEEAFSQFADALLKQGAIASKAQYMRTLPHEGVHLNFLPFLQGMLYVGNIAPLVEDNIDLIQAVAEAFSTAYARYEDFNKLEAAKQQVDNTLSDLKATQMQLIQTEKMASLGELTAGIAHEIQNPLNFVNNFSEVNAELIEEMQEEIEKGDLEEIKAIAFDIAENSKKISMHGKRADGIVKGMLQHSQSGNGVKELTNINSVADEYMRLAYHGLRAKDKSFNAELVTHFDPDLPKIKVIPQDIGRVMLNLFNNAFYAVNKKRLTAGPNYKPELTVSTCAENGQVRIKVKDNGTGIPDDIKEKIMQPFFTTKPTGEGTGLGLSLTYDMVVKGHGGKINIESKEGEGSEFIIDLPIA